MSDWKYDLDEVGEDADADGDSDAPTDANGPADAPADADGPLDEEFDPVEAEAEPIEPGSPKLENAFFVALGVATTLAAFARVVLLAGG